MLQAPLCGQHEEGSNLGTLSDVESENQRRYGIHLIFTALITLCVVEPGPCVSSKFHKTAIVCLQKCCSPTGSVACAARPVLSRRMAVLAV